MRVFLVEKVQVLSVVIQGMVVLFPFSFHSISLNFRHLEDLNIIIIRKSHHGDKGMMKILNLIKVKLFLTTLCLNFSLFAGVYPGECDQYFDLSKIPEDVNSVSIYIKQGVDGFIEQHIAFFTSVDLGTSLFLLPKEGWKKRSDRVWIYTNGRGFVYSLPNKRHMEYRIMYDRGMPSEERVKFFEKFPIIKMKYKDRVISFNFNKTSNMNFFTPFLMSLKNYFKHFSENPDVFVCTPEKGTVFIVNFD